ncbi:MAG: N-acetyltransferase [Bacteroidales bacterium]|nr:N-acetyltransferase [Bacteroidales bacterium]
MPVTIKKVQSRRDLKTFVRFPEKLYKDNKYYVPKIEFDQIDTLDPKVSPSAEFCDSALYLAYKDDELVGRVAAIVNNKANEQWNHKEVRFGWYDFVDDKEVSKALMDKVEEFGREHEMDAIVGPLGFTDFDPEGMLVAGYDKLSTMALIYNHPYYVDHVESMGFEKEIDWFEYKVTVPKDHLPEKLERVANIVKDRYGVHVRPITKKLLKQNNGEYVEKIFGIINECYKVLYNYTVLPRSMADKYIGFYLKVLDLKYVTVLEDSNNEIVAFGICMPSIVEALQKSRGRLFPFGWVHFLKSLYLKHEPGVEAMLIGVRPDYQNTGINSLIWADMFEKVRNDHFEWAETNAILETNFKNASQWNLFECEGGKVRRSYKKILEK